MLKCQDLETMDEMEMEKVKVDTSHATTGTEGRTEETAGTKQEETIAFGQSWDISSGPQARPEGAIAAPCRPGAEDTESESHCPVLERSICDTLPTLTCDPDATKSHNQTSLAAKHHGKVITTDVTINALTVTFLEAAVAEGFFKGH